MHKMIPVCRSCNFPIDLHVATPEGGVKELPLKLAVILHIKTCPFTMTSAEFLTSHMLTHWN